MNRLNRKLRSRSGASITLALLFFLICAVLCSVIIAAATAAAGRMAQAAEMDQRYYAVTSAGELMKDLIHQKRVTIVKVTTSSATTPYTQSGTGYVAGAPVPSGSDSSRTYLISDKEVSEITSADCTNATKVENVTPTNIPQYAAKKLYNNPTDSPVDSRSFSLSSTTAMLSALGTERDPLAVTIKEELDSDGTITLLVHNTVQNPGDGTFTQKMVFDVTETDGSRTEVSNGPATYNGANQYSITTNTTKTETRSLIWNLVSVETVSVPVPVSSP